MQIFLGFLLVLLAALLQGTFVLPMTMVEGWSWEHTWATFSLLGMFFLNWILILLLVPNIFTVYAASPAHDLAVLALFGMGWGLGAVLFGLGMDKLGMALGYPIIMGLIAGLGALIPLLFLSLRVPAASEALIFLGTALVIVGIVVCSIGGSRRTLSGEKATTTDSTSFRAGLAIAIFAGVLSCLPNVGVAYAGNVVNVAAKLRVSSSSSGNTVWALLFTCGCIVNVAYCLYLMVRRKTLNQYFSRATPRNLGLSALMAAMWIGSFYLYGAGAARLGRPGIVVGWPLFISLSIAVGNIWGLWRGEWKGSPHEARRLLNQGLAILMVAIVTLAVSNLV
ncbi:MAG: L-rhamnose/proton symporter RhaT [Candidatus Sulfotelmatobacter sp.]